MASKTARPENPEIRRLAPGVFAIRGRLDWYTVARGRGCSCPGWKHWGKCWHVEAVKAWVCAEATQAWTPAVEGACGAV
jgi:hypothetical protein